MNPFRIYRDEWASALSKQTTASEYHTFIAMPLQERFSYRANEVQDKVINTAIEEANKRKIAKRQFHPADRVNIPGGAIAINDEIVTRILESHFFIGDLTFENTGVILETGIALGIKPNRQIILITQDSLNDLHFDLRNNNVINYNTADHIDKIASAFIAAAQAFEEHSQYQIQTITRRLSPESILALNWYGQIQRSNQGASLHAGNLGPFFEGPDGRIRFETATQELRNKDLLWTEYSVGAIPEGDEYGMHATELGWAVIENMWADLRRSNQDT